MAAISVIVPVYNVERYVSRCIESVLSQSFLDFELLLIDDGSKDSSGNICDEYAQKDNRIQVYHKENAGLSDARNYGIDRMTGRYVTFIDSDDYVGRDYLKLLLETIEETHAVISAVSMAYTLSEDVVYVESTDERMLLSGEEMLREMLIGQKTSVSACAKLYKCEIFREVRFPKNMLYEDLYTTPYLIEPGQRYGFCASKQYYYFQRSGSIMNSVSDASIRMWLGSMDKVMEHTKSQFPGCSDYAAVKFLIGIFWTIIDRLLWDKEYMQIASAIKKRYFRYFISAFKLPQLTTKEKLKALLFALSARLYRVIRIRWIKNNPEAKRRLPVPEGF